MSAANDRCRRVERDLAALGIHARVESVGEGDAIALVRPAGGSFDGLLSKDREGVVDVCRAAGFRDAAVELFWE